MMSKGAEKLILEVSDALILSLLIGLNQSFRCSSRSFFLNLNPPYCYLLFAFFSSRSFKSSSESSHSAFSICLFAAEVPTNKLNIGCGFGSPRLCTTKTTLNSSANFTISCLDFAKSFYNGCQLRLRSGTKSWGFLLF